MTKKLTELTGPQRDRMPSYAQQWIEYGLRTTPLTDREWKTWEAAAQRCYQYAGISWPGVIVHVSSPIVGAFAAPVAAYLIAGVNNRGAVDAAVHDAVHVAVRGAVNAAVGIAVRGAVRGAVNDAVRSDVNDAVRSAVNGAVHGAVGGAVNDAVDAAARGAVGAVSGAVGDAVDDAVHVAVHGAVHGAVLDAVRGAVHGAVNDAVRSDVRGAVHGAVSGAVDDAVSGAVDDAMSVAVLDAVRGAVHGAVSGAVDDAVSGAVNDAMLDAVSGAVHGAVSGAVDDAVSGAVHGAVSGAVNDAMSVAMSGAVSGAVEGPVHGAVSGAVNDAVSGAVDDAMSGAVNDAMSVAMSGAVSGAVEGPVHGAVSGAVNDAVRGAMDRMWYCRQCGRHWSAWNAYIGFFRDIAKLDLPTDIWDRSRAYDVAQSAGWWWPFKDFVMVADLPTEIHRERIEEDGWGSHRLHYEDGPAVRWADGWGVYSWHGVRVPAWVIENPTVEQALKEPNSEVRRAAFEAIGWDKAIAELDLTPIDSRTDFANADNRLELYALPREIYEQPVNLLLMTNASPDRDGHVRRYGETVPAGIKRADEAAAWQSAVPVEVYRQLQRCT